MQVLVTTDNNVDGSADLTSWVEDTVSDGLRRFEQRLTRVVVHFTDDNSAAKTTSNDKRCALEARPAGLQPITVNAVGDTLEQALDGAIDKLKKSLDRTLGRLTDGKGRVSAGGERKE